MGPSLFSPLPPSLLSHPLPLPLSPAAAPSLTPLSPVTSRSLTPLPPSLLSHPRRDSVWRGSCAERQRERRAERVARTPPATTRVARPVAAAWDSVGSMGGAALLPTPPLGLIRWTAADPGPARPDLVVAWRPDQVAGMWIRRR